MLCTADNLSEIVQCIECDWRGQVAASISHGDGIARCAICGGLVEEECDAPDVIVDSSEPALADTR